MSTTYLHVLTGENPVVDWMMGTGLRPYLTALADDPATWDAFLASYSQKIAREFPKRADGTTLIPFPRLFILARRR
jgi:trans-aconitate 2-methyltransferase